jgi:uncharacterized membrane protein YeaQ/YmgE (transglycosylase-associated protein family)
MQILLALIFGAVYGGVLHVLMPGRASRGAVLAPILGAVLSGLVYVALTWAGVGAAIVIVPLVLTVLTRTRATHDANERLRLKIS